MKDAPLIFLTFANDEEGVFLNALIPEKDAIQSILIRYQKKGWGSFYSSATTEPDKLLRDLNEFKTQLLVFHFSGHNDGNKLNFQTAENKNIAFNTTSLKDFLQAAPNLQLVFLNACKTLDHVESLLYSGIPAIIATSHEVNDYKAAEFSKSFYGSFVAGDTLEEAFNKAKAVIEPGAENQRVFRSLYFGEEEEKLEDELEWGLYVADDSMLSWKLRDGYSIKTNNFTESISSTMALLRQKVKNLTDDQYRTLRMIRVNKRVRISGCAGSGKTLVAAEKAIRLSNVGIDTLLLCHNPYLADKLERLVAGSGVEVFSFGNWINSLNGKPPIDYGKEWTNIYEPTDSELESAFEKIYHGQKTYGAIIVDEGQDFREKWWTILELLLENSTNSFFYIFHDDNQALLPFRGKYPIESPVIDLSRNCRNGGEIFNFMRKNFHFNAPLASEDLVGLGEVKLYSYKEIERVFNELLPNAVRWIEKFEGLNEIAILLSGSLRVKDWDLNQILIRKPKGSGWKDELYLRLLEAVNNGKLIKKGYNSDWIKHKFENLGLSSDELPSNKDIESVIELANSIGLDINNHSAPISFTERANRIYWKNMNGKMKMLYRRRDLGLWGSEIVLFFQDENWAEGLYTETVINFNTPITNNSKTYRVYDVSQYKGLEADGVILIHQGSHANLKENLYVGVSRAKAALAIITDSEGEQYIRDL